MEEQWFFYYLVDGKRSNTPELELSIGDRICVCHRLVSWFRAYYGIPQGASYGFRVKKLKENSVLSVSVDGTLQST